MAVILNIHKTIEQLGKIKISYITLLFSFICSFNLWFLAIYFFKNELIVNHGLIITLLTTFAFTISWCLIIGISVPKFIILMLLTFDSKALDDFGNDESKNFTNLFVFLETILVHSLFLYLQYIFKFSFVQYFSIQFFFAILQYLVVDVFVKYAYEKAKKKEKESN